MALKLYNRYEILLMQYSPIEETLIFTMLIRKDIQLKNHTR